MTDSSSSPSPKKGGISCLGWFLIGSFAFFAVAMAIVAILPDNEERASTPSFRSTAATSTPRPASTRSPATPAIQASRACPADSDDDLNLWSTNASAEIKKRGGPSLTPARIKSDVLEIAEEFYPNSRDSCLSLFSAYVIAESAN